MIEVNAVIVVERDVISKRLLTGIWSSIWNIRAISQNKLLQNIFKYFICLVNVQCSELYFVLQKQ